MPVFRVETAGVTIWTGTFETADVTNIPAEYLERPADPAAGEPYPPAHNLFIDDTLIGVQICLAQEAAGV